MRFVCSAAAVHKEGNKLKKGKGRPAKGVIDNTKEPGVKEIRSIFRFLIRETIQRKLVHKYTPSEEERKEMSNLLFNRFHLTKKEINQIKDLESEVGD